MDPETYPELESMDKLYSDEYCSKAGFISERISNQAIKNIQGCVHNSQMSERVCAYVRNFAIPFNQLCSTCSEEVMSQSYFMILMIVSAVPIHGLAFSYAYQVTLSRSDYLMHIFLYMSGATTIGYTSMEDFFLEDHIYRADIQHTMSIILTFSGITFMAIMEAYIMFYLLEEIQPLMWAQHNLQYLNHLLQKEHLKKVTPESHGYSIVGATSLVLNKILKPIF